MQPPKLELIPARPVVCVDEPCILDVLVRIIPPVPEVHFLRPPINLGIVLDRSGSMSTGRKIENACEAACFAINQLLPTDRVSVTVYDDQIETIAPSALVTDKPGLIARIRQIKPRGSTALHDGWSAGAAQVAGEVVWNGLNRVVLLSDGLANFGVTDPTAIRADVSGMTSRGVSTSTIGVGDDYNEDLLEAMALAGDGNYYYVQESVQLTDIFQTELNGLMTTTGRDVGLQIDTAPGIRLVEILTEVERDPSGRLKLPNLIMGMPISIVVRLAVMTHATRSEICRVTLDWEEPRGDARGPQSLAAALIMSAAPESEWSTMPIDSAVAEQVALLMAAKARKEVIAALDRNDVATAQGCFNQIREILQNAPQTAEVENEINDMQSTRVLLDQGEFNATRKASHYRQSYRKQGKSTPPQE